MRFLILIKHIPQKAIKYLMCLVCTKQKKPDNKQAPEDSL